MLWQRTKPLLHCEVIHQLPGRVRIGCRALRYLEWTWDPDPADTQYLFAMVYLLREEGGELRTVLDEHHCGLYGHEDLLRIIARAAFIGAGLVSINME